jgi:hypothetical protein
MRATAGWTKNDSRFPVTPISSPLDHTDRPQARHLLRPPGAVIYILADLFIPLRFCACFRARRREMLRENKAFAPRGPWRRRPKEGISCPVGARLTPDLKHFDKSSQS